MYLITEADDLELPLATADTLRELASMCNTEIPVVCRIIRQDRITRKYKNTPAQFTRLMINLGFKDRAAKLISPSANAARRMPTFAGP